ncbi:MAG: trypsin-like peptidase domain-containing protein [Ectothiorhodospiraceae bacterium]|nr:trypsin-like peptidase domain-containing protein [Ectothiorhodospiraceae bacterium]
MFILKATIVGLAAAFVILIFRPDLLGMQTSTPQRPVVELKQSPSVATQPGGFGYGPVSYAQAVNAAAPAVVNVYTTKVITERANPLLRYFFGDQYTPRQHLESSLGSGVIVSDTGFIITNNHVIDGAAGIEVLLRDGRSAEAKLVGTDPETDVAILKIDLDNVPSITFNMAGGMRVGDVVLAIGNPFGVGQTVTMGIISATGRDQVGISTFESFIQTDAAINPGNSGGALIDAYGNLVGINTAIFTKSGGSQGIGFAIPMSIARNVMQQLIETGRVSRGWLGVETQDITPQLAESFSLQNITGIIVAGIQRNGPAAQAGLRPGDIILSINGEASGNSKTVMNQIARVSPGGKLQMKILRNGKELDTQAIVGERPAPRRQRMNRG